MNEQRDNQPTGRENGTVNIGRHQAQCSVCKHPERDEIELAWIEWGYTNGIAQNMA